VDWVTIIGISMVVQMFSAIVIGSLSDPPPGHFLPST
jgi:hypothetical protein